MLMVGCYSNVAMTVVVRDQTWENQPCECISHLIEYSVISSVKEYLHSVNFKRFPIKFLHQRQKICFVSESYNKTKLKKLAIFM